MTQETLLKIRTEVLYLRDRVTNLENLLKEESENLKEFTFTDISLSLNNYVDEYIDNYSPRIFDSDELGKIDSDLESSSINIFFEIIKDGIKSFICAWEEKTLQERKSSTEEV